MGMIASFGKPFAWQVAAYRLRLGNLVGTQAWDDLRGAEHDRAFMVAGAMKAELLADLATAVDKAVSQGTSLQEFRRDFRDIVEKRGWHGWTGEGTKKGEAWRTKVIYKTNLATSYAAGRMAQLKASGFAFWVYQHGNSMEPRIEHLGWDGLVLEADHPFWATHAPPNGWGCSCFITGARSRAGAARVGGKPDKPLPEGWLARDPRTGAPIGISKGWDHGAGASVASTLPHIVDKLAALPALTGAQMIDAWQGHLFHAWSQGFAKFVDATLQGPPKGASIVVGALKPSWVQDATTLGVAPISSEIRVRDQDIWHTFRDAKAGKSVDPVWYRTLPQVLRSPEAVLLDTSKPDAPVLLLIYPNGDDSQTKLVLRLNYILKKLGISNIIETGRIQPTRAVKERIGSGAVLIEGVI
jgi:hypothetical protein